MERTQSCQDGGQQNVNADPGGRHKTKGSKANMKADGAMHQSNHIQNQMPNNMPPMSNYGNNISDNDTMKHSQGMSDIGPPNSNYGPYGHHGYQSTHMNNFKGPMMQNRQQMPNMYPGVMNMSSNYPQHPASSNRMPSTGQTPTLNQLLQNSPNSPQPNTRFTDSVQTTIKSEGPSEPSMNSNGPYMGQGGWQGPGSFPMQQMNQQYMRSQYPGMPGGEQRPGLQNPYQGGPSGPSPHPGSGPHPGPYPGMYGGYNNYNMPPQQQMHHPQHPNQAFPQHMMGQRMPHPHQLSPHQQPGMKPGPDQNNAQSYGPPPDGVTGPNRPTPPPRAQSDQQSEVGAHCHGDGSLKDPTSPQETSNQDDVSSEGSSGAPRHPSLSANQRPPRTPSVGSQGSRSTTPASIPGNQVGSPMPTRPPSGQSPQMSQPGPNNGGSSMPPPMGYHAQLQAHYSSGNKSSGGPGGAGTVGSGPGGPGMMMGQPPYQSSPNQYMTGGGNNYPPGQSSYPPQVNNYSGPNHATPGMRPYMSHHSGAGPHMSQGGPHMSGGPGPHVPQSGPGYQAMYGAQMNQYQSYNNMPYPPQPSNEASPPTNLGSTHLNNMAGMQTQVGSPGMKSSAQTAAQAAAQAAMLAAASSANRMQRPPPGPRPYGANEAMDDNHSDRGHTPNNNATPASPGQYPHPAHPYPHHSSMADHPPNVTSPSSNDDASSQSSIATVTMAESNQSAVNHDVMVMNHESNSCHSIMSDESVEMKAPKKAKKSGPTDIQRLYDFGDEPDRRSFIDRYLMFMEERGNPLTSIPVISKTPIDLYRLYRAVSERGGVLEVTRQKKWKDVSTLINVGASASAAYTCRKNYVKFMLPLECRDRGGLDPNAVQGQLEAMNTRKDSRRNRVPSPASSHEVFRPPSSSAPPGMPAPGMEMYGQPPPPHMPNSDLGNMSMHQQQMMPNQMPGMPNQNMMPGMHGMPNAGMHGMPPGQLQSNMMINNMSGGESVTVHDPFDDVNTSKQYPRMPYGAPLANQTPANSAYNMYNQQQRMNNQSQFRVPAPDGSSVAPFHNEGEHGGGGDLRARLQTPDSLRTDSPAPSTGQTQNRSATSSPYTPYKYDPAAGNSSPAPKQGSGPATPPPSLTPQPGDQSPYPPRFTSPHSQNQLPPYSSPADIMTSSAHNTMTSQQHIGPRQTFPGPGGDQGRHGPFSSHDQTNGDHVTGPPPQTSGFAHGLPGYSDKVPGSAPPYSYPGPGPRPMLPHDVTNMNDGRGPDHWAPPMGQRYPMVHNSYNGPNSMGPQGPNFPPHLTPYQQRPPHMSPPSKMPYQSPGKIHPIHASVPFGVKRGDAFPNDSVEAVQPNMYKAKKIVAKDIIPVEAWRIMVALKSGLLAESTWALDVLSILLYDDNTVAFFSLKNLPGLLDILVEHFRHCLVQMFGLFDEQLPGEDGDDEKTCRRKHELSDMALIKNEILQPKFTLAGDIESENYTWVTRQGKPVKIEEHSIDKEMLLDSCDWGLDTDQECVVRTKAKRARRHVCETTTHIVSHLESSHSVQAGSSLFLGKLERHAGWTHSSQTTTPQKRKRKQCRCLCKTWPIDDVIPPDDIAKQHLLTEEDAAIDITVTKVKLKVKDEPMELCESEKPEKNALEDLPVEPSPEIFPLDFSRKTLDRMESGSRKVSAKTDKTPSSPVVVKSESAELVETTSKTVASVESVECPDLSNCSANGPEKPTENEENGVNASDRLDSNANNKVTEKPVALDEAKPPTCNPIIDDVSECRSVPVAPWPTTLIAMDNHMCHNELPCCSKSTCQSQPTKIDYEPESCQYDEPPLRLLTESKTELANRCICISNILRSLSFIPGNDSELSGNPILLYILGRLLVLKHRHAKRSHAPRSFEREEIDLDDIAVMNEDDWWFAPLRLIRENSLVLLANISGKLHLADKSEAICLPLLDGLLHWAVCPSSEAQDPLPNHSPTSVLSPQRLVLEALCKLSIDPHNVDLILATPPYSRLANLVTILVRFLSEKKDQVLKEFAIVLFSYLVQGDTVAARTIALQEPSVSLLVDFVETAEQNAMQIANEHGVNMLRENPETMGTSLDMLRRAANTLAHLARVPENRSLFVQHEQRLLSLVMSQILDQHVAQIIADVVYECSRANSS